MFSKDNIQPSINPKLLTVQRGYADGEVINGEVFIRNVSVDPRTLINAPQYVPRKNGASLANALMWLLTK